MTIDAPTVAASGLGGGVETMPRGGNLGGELSDKSLSGTIVPPV